MSLIMQKLMLSWWWNRKNSTLWNSSLNTFCHVSRIWHCWSLMPSGNLTEFISLPCIQILVPGRAVTGWATTLQSRMWRAAKGHRWELQGSPGGVWNHARKLHKCLIFQNPTAFRADSRSQLFLSHVVLQHFHPACSFFFLIFEIYTVTPFFQLLHVWCLGGLFIASLKSLG